jgi:hypothetical protein
MSGKFLKYSIDFVNLLWILNLPLIVVILQDDKENKIVLTFYHVCFISMSSFLHFISYFFLKKLDKINKNEKENINLEEVNVFLSLINFVHLLLLMYFLVFVQTYSIIYNLTIIYITLPIVVNLLQILKNRHGKKI